MTFPLTPRQVADATQRGDVRLLDLRTRGERRRRGWPPGAEKVPFWRHVLRPEGPGAAYLSQRARRSKLTGRRGAAEVAGGFVAWQDAGLPVTREHPAPPEQAPR